MLSGFEMHLPRGRQAEFALYAPSHDGVPLVNYADDPLTGAAVAVIGAIYYRDELVCGLPATKSVDADADIALAIFRHRGVAGLERLDGEFALVLFDAAHRTVVALRDPLGSWPLYWVQTSDGVRVATSMRLLARHVATRT